MCTQPRRISATAVAERVAEERVDKLGNMVGYQIRLETRMVREKPIIFSSVHKLGKNVDCISLIEEVT